jgi:hypothetical protein
MKRNFLVIGIMIFIIVIIVMYIITNKKNNIVNENKSITQVENNITAENKSEINNDNNPKEIVSLLEIPIPDSIIFYHNGVQKSFFKGSDEFNEIINLNNKRDSDKLGALQLIVDIDGLLKNTDMLEYVYQNYNSIYFNLIRDEQLEKNNTDINWVSVGYDSKIFKQFIYSGLASADELINYLYSLK